MTSNYRIQEVEYKLEKVREMLLQENLGAVLLTKQYNICWLTAGGNNHVLYDMQESLIGILITPETATVIAENGDYFRLIDEEFSHCPFEYRKTFWNSAGIAVEAVKLSNGRIGVDTLDSGIKDGVNVSGLLQKYRSVLTENEIHRLKEYGLEAAEILTGSALKTKKGMSESEVAANLAKDFFLKGFNVAVILIGGDNRSLRYRHQVVSDHKIQKHFCLCGVGKKAGLTFPINRVISFGEPPNYLKENYNLIEKVFVSLNSTVRIGMKLKDIYHQLPGIYKNIGLDDKEWEQHSIGGTMGYLPREECISALSEYTIVKNNVIGWNPSLPGVMSEDVYLVNDNTIECVSQDTKWPSKVVEVDGYKQVRPDILVL
jgi:Xaa-Pro dipeptidase